MPILRLAYVQSYLRHKPEAKCENECLFARVCLSCAHTLSDSLVCFHTHCLIPWSAALLIILSHSHEPSEWLIAAFKLTKLLMNIFLYGERLALKHLPKIYGKPKPRPHDHPLSIINSCNIYNIYRFRASKFINVKNILNIWHSRDPVAIRFINIINTINILNMKKYSNIYNIYTFRASKFINIINIISIWHSRDPVAIKFIDIINIINMINIININNIYKFRAFKFINIINILNIWHSRNPVAIKFINITNIVNSYNIYKFRASKFINTINIFLFINLIATGSRECHIFIIFIILINLEARNV